MKLQREAFQGAGGFEEIENGFEGDFNSEDGEESGGEGEFK